MCRSTRASESGTAGFTLIEALAALAVAAAGIAAIGSLSFSGLRAGRAVEQHLALVASARQILASMPARAELLDGELGGVAGNYRWRTEAGPFAHDAGNSNAGSIWEPQSIAMRVLGPTGATIEIETVRLRKRTSQ